MWKITNVSIFMCIYSMFSYIQLSKADWGFESKILLDINTVPCSVVWEDIRYIITITKLWYIQANLMCKSNAIQMIKGKLCNLKKSFNMVTWITQFYRLWVFLFISVRKNDQGCNVHRICGLVWNNYVQFQSYFLMQQFRHSNAACCQNEYLL